MPKDQRVKWREAKARYRQKLKDQGRTPAQGQPRDWQDEFYDNVV